MGIKVKGIRQVKQRLNQVVGEVQSQKATRAMFRILNAVALLRRTIRLLIPQR